MPVTVYGIPNCSSVKKALDSLTSSGIEYRFHDFRKAGLDRKLLEAWLKQVDLSTLINRKGTTWRMLSDAERQQAEQNDSAVALLLDKPTLIKRPVVDRDGRITVGQTQFDPTP